ncbi:hypothetical protein ACVIW2_005174 [Bradyrhizobium huanghuaihaiense]|uniref:Uncharacterized protein n=1 Tax=Bradyrhizobium huanghuaihaiense TaxID=990078 RepID=A0A562R8X0_9BRAD|nr:hypothetical protein [Bradyrhizobium huanghuaihaiense]TWI64880.1 hypothetical protein IQ16_05508 [Bradyrhizobium huanghuaihaiense]
MDVNAMDEATRGDKIHLRGGPSLQERLLGAGFGIAALFFADAESGVSTFVSIAIGAAILGYAALATDVLWSISANGIVIGRMRPFGRPQTRVIRRDDIAAMQVQSDKTDATDFRILLRLSSGDCLLSPPIAEVTRVSETNNMIADLLRLPHGNPPANPMDAANTEMRIGNPVRKAAGSRTRILALIIAGLCTIPYAYKFWSGLPLSTGEMIFPAVGLVIAFAVFRYAYALAGTSWIVRQGELRIERMSRGAVPTADTISGSDVEAISIECPPEGNCLVRIELRSGKKLWSPEIGTQAQARAVSDEIVRRLGIAPEKVRR